MQNPDERNGDRKSRWKKNLFYIFVVLVVAIGFATILLWCPIVTLLNLPRWCASYQGPITTNDDPNYTGFNFVLGLNDDLFKWAEKCDFNGYDIGKMTNSSLGSCGNACAAKLNCDRFSFDDVTATCFLKNWPTSNPAPKFKVSFYCGYVIGRPTMETPIPTIIPVGPQNTTTGYKGQNKTTTTTTSEPTTTAIPKTDNYTEFEFTLENATDLFKTSENCNFASHDIGQLKDISTLRSCGEACVANPNCTRFSYLPSPYCLCYLKKWPISNPPPDAHRISTINGIDYYYSCGYVMGRTFNASKDETTTTTTSTTTPIPSVKNTTTTTIPDYVGFNFTLDVNGYSNGLHHVISKIWMTLI